MRFGLWPRLALLLAATVLIAAAVPGWFSLRDVQEAAWRNLRARATAVTTAAASNAAFCLSGSQVECSQLTNVLLEIDDVAWAVIVDSAGEIPPGGEGFRGIGRRGFQRVRFRGVVPRGPDTRRVRHAGVEYLAVVMPIAGPEPSGGLDLFLGTAGPVQDAPRGAVELGFDMTSTERLLDAAVERALVVGATVFVVALLFGALFARFLTRPLLKMARVSERIARGDLSERLDIDSQDEMGLVSTTFNGMISAMRSSLDKMNATAHRIDDAAADLVRLMSAQRIGAGVNLATVSATMGTLSEIVASSGEAERRGRTAMELAQRAMASSEQMAATGQRALEDAVSEMERLEAHVAGIAARVRPLADSAAQLGSVIETLAGFADRFHDLSIQVSQRALEAGRSGSSGEATFAGLVSTARVQARDAQRATTTVRRLVGHVQSESRRALQSVEDGARAAEVAMHRVREAAASVEVRGTTLRDGAKASRQIAELIQEQLDKMEDVLSGVENVRRATVQFSSAADQTLDTAKSLTRVSSELKEILAGYRLDS